MLTRTFTPITENFENFNGDGVARLGKFLVIYFNKQYGSNIMLLDVITSHTRPPVIIKTFEFNHFMYGVHIQNSIINFFSETRELFQLDVSPYNSVSTPAELMQMLDDKYLVSSLLYDAPSDIEEIIGRYGDYSNGGLIIRGKLKRKARYQTTQLRRPSSASYLSVFVSA